MIIVINSYSTFPCLFPQRESFSFISMSYNFILFHFWVSLLFWSFYPFLQLVVVRVYTKDWTDRNIVFRSLCFILNYFIHNTDSSFYFVITLEKLLYPSIKFTASISNLINIKNARHKLPNCKITSSASTNKLRGKFPCIFAWSIAESFQTIKLLFANRWIFKLIRLVSSCRDGVNFGWNLGNRSQCNLVSGEIMFHSSKEVCYTNCLDH